MKNLVDKKTFLNWYFQHNDDILTVGNMIVDKLEENDVATISIKEIFDTCGYIPYHIINDYEGESLDPKNCILLTDFAYKYIEIRRKDYPNDTIYLRNLDLVKTFDSSQDYCKKLLENEMQEMIVQKIATNRCSGCNYKLKAYRIKENVYELK